MSGEWYKRLVRRPIASLAAILLLACLALAGAGLDAHCSTSADEPFGDCAGLCLDCGCCPNGVSTSGETGMPLTGLVSLRPAFETLVSSAVDVPPAEILHIPKLPLL